MVKKLLAVSLAAIFCCAAQAHSVEQYLFADEAIGVYSAMRESLNIPAHPEPFEGADILKFYLENTVRQGNVYRTEVNALKQYDKAKDQGIRQANTILVSGIFLIMSANSNFASYLEKVLNNPKMLLQQGTVSRQMAELSDAMETAWQTYGKTAAGGVTYALTDTPRNIKDLQKNSSKTTVSLLITQSEINLLKAHLKQSFGPVIADNAQAKWADLPAISTWKFLNDAWVPAPEQ